MGEVILHGLDGNKLLGPRNGGLGYEIPQLFY